MKSIFEPVDAYWEIDRLGTTVWPALPTGITVHYTADGDILRVKREMINSKLGYHFLIDRDGSLHQTASLAKAVNHAGKAGWNGQSPNRTHVAIAIVSWGLLSDDYRAWTGMKVAGVRRHDKIWDVATVHQEKRLIGLIQDLIRDFGISPINVCGHDECALPKGRKTDPGGVLSKSMAEIRKELSI